MKGKNKVIEVDDEESKQSRSNDLKIEDKPLVSHVSSIETYKSSSSCVDKNNNEIVKFSPPDNKCDESQHDNRESMRQFYNQIMLNDPKKHEN